MSGRVVHFEIPFDDGERGRAFYRDVFGWELMDVPEMAYTLVTTGPVGPEGSTEPGYINGGMLRRESPNDGPILVIEVDDIEAALAKVEEHGGRTLLGRQEVGDMGWSAYFKDAEGNAMGLWQSRDQSA
jgi:predicted enzyme related to lactoylglutathione lyase